MGNNIFDQYELFKEVFQKNNGIQESNTVLAKLFSSCTQYLKDKRREPLISNIPGKSYFAFSNGKKLTRPINEHLFSTSQKGIQQFLDVIGKGEFQKYSNIQITALCYSISIAFCACIDLIKEGDQKTPGTFFEYFMGHFFKVKLGVQPKNHIEVLNLDMKSKLPTDFIFDLGKGKPKYHVPVKTSTRERVIQVWAHQRVLDGVYGTGRFLGLLTCLSETKLDHKSKEVVEICLPDQWQLYQLFIAQMKRIYYLDVPVRYAALNSAFPKINVTQFGDFFHETSLLLD